MAEKIIWLVPKISRNLIQTDQSERDHQSKGGMALKGLGILARAYVGSTRHCHVKTNSTENTKLLFPRPI